MGELSEKSDTGENKKVFLVRTQKSNFFHFLIQDGAVLSNWKGENFTPLLQMGCEEKVVATASATASLDRCSILKPAPRVRYCHHKL